MRAGSSGVNNHITTKTTDVAMKRFKAIQKERISQFGYIAERDIFKT